MKNMLYIDNWMLTPLRNILLQERNYDKEYIDMYPIKWARDKNVCLADSAVRKASTKPKFPRSNEGKDNNYGMRNVVWI